MARERWPNPALNGRTRRSEARNSARLSNHKSGSHWFGTSDMVHSISASLMLPVVLTNPLLKWAMVRGGTQALGAKVEIGVLRSLLHRTAFQLHGVQVADPRSPMQNLFEVQQATFDLDTSQLLRRRLVVRGSLLWHAFARAEPRSLASRCIRRFGRRTLACAGLAPFARRDPACRAGLPPNKVLQRTGTPCRPRGLIACGQAVRRRCGAFPRPAAEHHVR